MKCRRPTALAPGRVTGDRRKGIGSRVLGLLALCAACGSGRPPPVGPDGGPPGCGGACPPSCRSLDDCDGGLGRAICVREACAAAGGGGVFGVARAQLPAAFGGDSAATLAVRVLASARPDGSALDCPTLVGGLDAGTLDPDDPASLNPLLAPYRVPAHLAAGQAVASFEIEAVAGGPARLLLVEGFLQVGDGGPAAAGCAPYDAEDGADGGAPTVGLTLYPW